MGDFGIIGGLPQNGEFQVELGGAVAVVLPERPVHARQGWHRRANLGEPLAKVIQKLPTAEFFLVDDFLGATHTRSKSEIT